MSEIYERLCKENYIIGIPSRGRTHLIKKKIGVWKYILTDKKYPIIPFVRAEEYNDYYEILNKMNIPVFSIPNDYNIAQKRNAIYEYSKKFGGCEYLFIIDDDIVLSARNEDLASKYESKYSKILENDVFNKILYESIKLCGPNYPIVGLPLRQGSQILKYTFIKNRPIIRFVCYHLPTLKSENIKMDGLSTAFMSDRYTQLSLLNMGYSSLINARYAIDDHGTNYKGGCSITRTTELQSEAAMRLQSSFPNYIEIITKQNSSWDEERLDCKINWKGFLKEGEKDFIPKEEGLSLIYGGTNNDIEIK